MCRYLEYDTASGKIISEIKALNPPEVTAGMSLLEIGDDERIEISLYAVRNGSLVKVVETNSEKQERERVRSEREKSARRRINSIRQEYVSALLEDNEKEVSRLKNEYRKLKVYL